MPAEHQGSAEIQGFRQRPMVKTPLAQVTHSSFSACKGSKLLGTVL